MTSFFTRKAYKALTSGLFTLIFPPFWIYEKLTDKYNEHINQRFGLYPEMINQISELPCIWIHAASVGEVGVARSIIDSLVHKIPEFRLIISTTTKTGQAFARQKFGSIGTCIYAPLDFVPSVRRGLKTFKPDILVFIETEIWPNWLFQAYNSGIKTAFVNGRISVSSIKKYRKISPFIKQTLKNVNAFSMINKADADRIKQIGAPEHRVFINGNAKFDLCVGKNDQDVKAKMISLFSLYNKQPVFIAGSTRNNEEEIIIEAYSEIIQYFPETILIIAPRHVKRAPLIKRLVMEKGFSCKLRTEFKTGQNRGNTSVVILDTIGELQDTYSIASIVFCGGSLVPLGGQNIVEPAAWGKPVLYGPSMEDFLEAKQLIEHAGAGIEIQNSSQLAQNIIALLSEPEQAEIIGKKAQHAVMSNTGAAARHASVIYRLLK